MSRSVKFLIGALTVSVILNFGLAGFVATRYVQDRVSSRFAALSETEPPAALRAAFREALQSDRRAFLGTLLGLRDARDRQHEILTAEKLDLEALETAQRETRVATEAFIEVLHRAVRTAASELPDADRRTIPKFRVSSLTRRGMVEDGEEP